MVQMTKLAAILFLPFESRTGQSSFQMVQIIIFESIRLDRFGMNKILFMTLFFYKTVQASEKNIRSGFQMVKTKWPPNHSKAGPICPVPTI
jgi:hypothetical protein